MFDLHIKRRIKHWWQRWTRGFDDSVTWNLEVEIAKWVCPRLKLFKKLNICYPGGDINADKWDEFLDDMIYAFDVMSRKYDIGFNRTADWERVKRGLELFGQYYFHLWW